ncbi:protoporphyrinogen/coproporphyrinogen oxidase [Bdellovibrio sp. HCB185ZH]|uniref:protoporphyrinogen/coproporphyrinogen oxidase n=1 Tax=Bdellovibrio sp. HCB185ZH TaxID=3394235 RepID=UPI0039A5C9AB
MKKITVVGAGFAGLTVALKLAQKGFAVEIHEKSSRVGGLLGTDYSEHGMAERAANSLILSNRSEQLFQDIGLKPALPLESSKKRFIFRGFPKSVPLNPLEILAVAFKVVPRVLFAKASLKPKALETLEAWGLRRLGKAPTRFLLGPAMQGIYANEPQDLSASLIIGPLFNKDREKFRGMMTGANGMQDLVNHLQQALEKLGVKIHLNSNVDIASIQGPVVLAASASAATELLKSYAPEVSALLARVRMSSLISTTVFFDKAQTKFKGFGCLIPRGLNLRTLGVLMPPYIFAGRDKTYNETWIMGGNNNQDLISLTDKELLNLIGTERKRLFKRQDSVLDARINRWDRALPMYDLELEKVQNELAQMKLPAGLFLHGNYLSGIGLSKILERSERLSEEIASQHV